MFHNIEINKPYFARLNDNEAPVKIVVNEKFESFKQLLNITIFHLGGREETTDINTEHNNFRIFDEPINSSFYYVVVEMKRFMADNNTIHKNIITLMDADEALKIANELTNDKKGINYQVIIKSTMEKL